MANIDGDALTEVHKAFLGFLKRAERNNDDVLTRTFVDTAPLMNSLHSINNQVIYGRRGTGKTHALKYLSKLVSEEGQHPIYIDLRQIGSNGALYADTSRPVAERGIGLILDVLGVVADELYTLALELIDEAPHPDQITTRIDDLTSSLTSVKLVGERTTEERIVQEDKESSEQKIGIAAKPTAVGGSASQSTGQMRTSLAESKSLSRGEEQRTVNFGDVGTAFNSLAAVLGNPRIWLLVDEWSEVPLDLQPYLADLFRRTILPLDSFVLKVAAIEHRSRFAIPKEDGEYIGFELGADVSADVNLDDFLVFDNDQEKSAGFFRQLLFRHYQAATESPKIETPDELVRVAFTQSPAFEELVRASEGVPRDAINLAAKLASKAYGRSASMTDVRTVARDWYQQDKAAIFKSWPQLDELMTHIIDTVIAKRRARAFLFPSNTRNSYIDRLFDGRIIHLLKRNISSNDDPGRRYDVYKIDYGCYVDLINTKQAPEGLFSAVLAEGAEEVNVEVPVDDYRSIRRAILPVEDLEKFAEKGVAVNG